jgi:hypothetical protein
VATAPTLAVSCLGAAVASLQLLWGIKILLSQLDAVVGKEAYLDLDRNLLTTHTVQRNASCVSPHPPLTVIPFDGKRSEITVEHTFAAAEARLGAGVTLQLHGRSIVTELRCPK